MAGPYAELEQTGDGDEDDLTVGDGEPELAALERERRAAEYLEPPALERGDVRALLGRDRLEVAGGGDQALRDVMLLALQPEQHPQQVDHRAEPARQFRRRLQPRQLMLRQGERRLHRLDHRRGALPVQADAPQLGQLLDGGRPVRGDLEQQIVADDPVARQIAALRLGLAPCGQRPQHRQKARVARAHLDALPRLPERLPVGCRVGQIRKLLGDPIAAPRLLQLAPEALVDHPQMDHVAERIGELLRRQRPPRPVREARGLVDPAFGDLADQGLVADFLAVAAHHGRELGIEQRGRHLPGQAMEHLDVLPRRMEHLEHLRIDHEREQGRQVDTGGQRIDRRVALRPRQLHQAQLGPVGAVAHELGIDGDVRLARQLRAQRRDFGGRGKQGHPAAVLRAKKAP